MNDALWLALSLAAVWLVLRQLPPSDKAIAKGLGVTALNLQMNQRRVRGVVAMPSATVDASIKCLKVVFADLRMTSEQWARKSDADRDDYTQSLCFSFCQGFMESDFHFTAAKQGWGLVMTFQTGEGAYMTTEHISSQLLVSAMTTQ